MEHPDVIQDHLATYVAKECCKGRIAVWPSFNGWLQIRDFCNAKEHTWQVEPNNYYYYGFDSEALQVHGPSLPWYIAMWLSFIECWYCVSFSYYEQWSYTLSHCIKSPYHG